ncbi:hypothetical protein [Pedobacter nyackensis]|uniref:Uncharacterized protein n=1 Tax=Pedobacter nyackensis TaxID=475255 RepID=A0A1W2CY75_9SPHI|nr:hypothetical protein [Pedobacter nyackensis]SMC89832.1 hypothetical protein SAMN04488101_10533 [Pedobacter nyackensis]
MMETFTSINNLNYPQHDKENVDFSEGSDLLFYDNIKFQLNMLKKDPSDESIAKILAYSKTR